MPPAGAERRGLWQVMGFFRKVFEFSKEPVPDGSIRFRRIAYVLKGTCWLTAIYLSFVALTIILLLMALAFTIFMAFAWGASGAFLAGLGIAFSILFVLMIAFALGAAAVQLAIGFFVQRAFNGVYHRWIHQHPKAVSSVRAMGVILVLIGFVGLFSTAVPLAVIGIETDNGEPTHDAPWQVWVVFVSVYIVPLLVPTVIGAFLITAPNQQTCHGGSGSRPTHAPRSHESHSMPKDLWSCPGCKRRYQVMPSPRPGILCPSCRRRPQQPPDTSILVVPERQHMQVLSFWPGVNEAKMPLAYDWDTDRTSAHARHLWITDVGGHANNHNNEIHSIIHNIFHIIHGWDTCVVDTHKGVRKLREIGGDEDEGTR